MYNQGLRICNTQTTHLPINIMINYTTMAKLFVGFALLIGIGTQVTVHKLDEATAQQCAAHDWPVTAHQVHMAWCAANGYSTN
jgi:hypothetical protein